MKKKKLKISYHCERSDAISDGLPRAHALAKTETDQSAFSCHSCQAQRERESMPRQARHDTIMLSCHCERSVPQATPTGGPVRDERSEYAISDGLPRAHTLAKTKSGRSASFCHSCQAQRERESMPRQARHDTFGQMGRSMVEMLGVLAIMGIVGMGGVKMYNVAMNKHRANELIYEAQKRATMVAMQITAGQENLSVANFTNPTGYVFGVEKNPQNANQFNITINAVDSDVCTQMKTAIGDGSVIRHIDDDCTELTFNNDLSKITAAQCTGSGKIWCGATGYCSDNGDCCLGGNCVADSCPTGTSTTGTGGSTGIFVGTSECKCASGKVYLGTECITKPTTCSSWTTNECGKGYYCNFAQTGANLNPSSGTANASEQQCYTGIEDTGTCRALTKEPPISTTISEMAILRQAGFNSTFLLGPRLNWWTASSWCLAHGRHLIDVTDMNCYRSSDGALVQAGQGATYCCKREEQCQQSTWNTNLWNGNEILNGQEVAKFGDKIVALRKVYGVKQFWTRSAYGNTSENSCFAFDVHIESGRVGSNTRRQNGYYALCE